MKTKCAALTKKKRQCTYSAKDDKYCTLHQKIIDNGGMVSDVPIAPVVPVIEQVAEETDDDLEQIVRERLEQIANHPVHNVQQTYQKYPEYQKFNGIRAEHKIGDKTYIIEIEGLDDLNLDEFLDREITQIQKEVNEFDANKLDANKLDANKLDANAKYECRCCFTEYGADDIIACAKCADHVACVECTKSYINGLIQDKKQIKCMMNPFDKCGYIYTDDQVEKVLDSENYSKYVEYKQVDTASQLASACNNYHICPFCSKWGAIVDNMFPGRHPQNVNHLTCANCDTMFCITCRQSYHGNDSCNKIDNSSADQIRKTIDRVIDSAVIHNCPKCHTKYAKEDGCNLMTCPSCNTMSCYLCDLVIVQRNGQKYWHFSNDTGNCTLYNNNNSSMEQAVKKGNIIYNNAKINKALRVLIAENSGNVQSMLRKEVFTRGYRL